MVSSRVHAASSHHVRPPLGPAFKQWVGDSRGHWDGDTLVVETTNFTDRTNVGQARHSARRAKDRGASEPNPRQLTGAFGRAAAADPSDSTGMMSA